MVVSARRVPGRDGASQTSTHAAGHRGFDRHLADDAVRGSDTGDTVEHLQRAAGKDDVGTAVDKGDIDRVGHQTLITGTAIVGRGVNRQIQCGEIIRAQQFLAGSSTEEHLAVRRAQAAFNQMLRQKDHGRHSYPAGNDKDLAGRWRQDKRTAEGAQDVKGLTRFPGGEQARAFTNHLVKHFDAIYTVVLSDQLVNRKRPPQQRLQALGYAQHDKLTRFGPRKAMAARQTDFKYRRSDRLVPGDVSFLLKHDGSSSQTDHGRKPTGGAFAAVGEKTVGMTAGAQLAGEYVLGRHAGLAQLVVTDGPEVEMVIGVFVRPEGPWNLLSVVHELRAAGTQRGADAGDQVTGRGAEGSRHLLQCAADDVADAAAPAGMDVGHHPPNRIVHHNGLAVGHLDREIAPLFSGHQGVYLRWSVVRWAGHNSNIGTVHLPGKHQFRCLETAPDALAVAVNPIRRVTDAEACIERAIRRPAAAVSTGEHRVPEFRKIL